MNNYRYYESALYGATNYDDWYEAASELDRMEGRIRSLGIIYTADGTYLGLAEEGDGGAGGGGGDGGAGGG